MVTKEGEKVEARQVVAILETEKTSYELEALHIGILHIITHANVTIPVFHLIGVLAETERGYEKIKSKVETSPDVRSLKRRDATCSTGKQGAAWDIACAALFLVSEKQSL